MYSHIAKMHNLDVEIKKTYGLVLMDSFPKACDCCFWMVIIPIIKASLQIILKDFTLNKNLVFSTGHFNLKCLTLLWQLLYVGMFACICGVK
jgi:hypothetical protein